MSSLKHTPGPWTIEEHEQQFGDADPVFGFYVDGKDGDEIVRLEGVRDHIEETRANTHLIAAAPDLLEALKVFAAAIPAYARDPTVPNRGVCAAISYTAGDFRVALAAIKKAEGA